MILAPNHPRLLSGSKILLLFSTTLFLLSCSTSKTVYTPSRVSTPKETPVKQDVPLVDTVKWEIVDEEVKPPIQNDEIDIIPQEKKDVYNVALMIPFEANKPDANTRATSDNSRTNRFVSFYAGTILALTQLEQEGLNLNVDVFDTQRSADKVKSDLKSFRMQNMDALIGPYATRSNKDGLIAAAEFGKENEITVVSPWYASSSLAKENPFYVQLRPNTADHFQKIMAHAKANFDDSEIVLVGRDQDDPKRRRSDENIIKYLQKVHKETSKDNSPDDLRVFRVQVDSLLNGETAYDSIFYETGRKAIIFPFYSSSGDGDFMYNCLRRINGEKSLEPVHVYTMPLALDSDQIGFNLFRNLNMKVCRSKFVDKQNADVRAFEREYYNRYGTIPNDDAYHGYDVMYFVGKNLMEYGRNFQFFVDESQQFLQSSFRLEGVPINETDPELESKALDNINYFVNKHLDIIEFQGENFKKLDE